MRCSAFSLGHASVNALLLLFSTDTFGAWALAIAAATAVVTTAVASAVVTP
jgi:hypothetical protein